MFGGPKGLAGGPRRGVPGDVWTTGFHGTRRRHVESILQEGLSLGGSRQGVTRTSSGMTAWPDKSYGVRPVFVFLRPSHPGYEWWNPGADDDDPVWLEVDLRGLTLYADLWELRDRTDAGVSERGLWWGPGTQPMVDATPEALRPYLDENHFLTFEDLLDRAAEAAIQLSQSAAILVPVPAHRIGPTNRK